MKSHTEYMREYRKTEKGKEAMSRWRNSEKGKASRKKYQRSLKGRIARRKYKSGKEKPFLGKTGMSARNVYSRIERLEEQMGII